MKILEKKSLKVLIFQKKLKILKNFKYQTKIYGQMKRLGNENFGKSENFGKKITKFRDIFLC